MVTTTTASPALYNLAEHDAVLTDRSDLGMLKITGETRLDLIHRMSTQDVNGLGSGQGAATVLTTDIGRIIDRLILYTSSEAVYALTGPGNADNIARYLMGFVFFNDDFHIEDASADTAIYAVYGPRSAARLADAGFDDPGALPLHHWRQEKIAGVTAYLHRTDPIAGDGYFVMAQTAEKEALRELLHGAGLTEADAATFEALRVAHGVPLLGHELTTDFIPLEANLWPDVSFSKGCYIGQEIIARMESRGRLAKKLMRLRPASPLAPGVALQAGGRSAGTVTSTAVTPEGPVALGYVKTSVLAATSELTADGVAVTLAGAAA